MLTRGWVRLAMGLVLGLLGCIGLLRLLVFPVTTEVERPAETAFEMRLRDIPWINGAWSPSGGQLLIRGLDALYLVDVNRRLSQPLSPHGRSALRPVWSPNGQYVAYVLVDFYGSADQVNIQDVFTGGTREINLNMQKVHYLEWSLDGLAVVFQADWTLWRYSLPDDSLKGLHIDHKSSGQWNVWQSSLSPDRRYAVVLSGTQNEATGTIQDTLLDFVDLTIARVVPTIDTGLIITDLMWSDDSQYFAYIGIQASSGNQQLKIVDRITGERCSLDLDSGNSGYLLDWSSDNELLWREEDTENLILHQTRASHCANTEILRSKNWDSWGLWSPDDRYIAITSLGRLTIMDASLNRAVDYAVPSAVSWFEPPVWSPDSRYVAASVYPGCPPAVEIVIIDVETGQLRYKKSARTGGFMGNIHWTADSQLQMAYAKWVNSSIVAAQHCP